MSLKFSGFLHIDIAHFSKYRCMLSFFFFFLGYGKMVIFFPLRLLSFCKGSVLVQVLVAALYRNTL